jgi:hypothetical protein
MFERFLSLPISIYQTQMDLSVWGLLAEFGAVFTFTFLIGIYRCTERSAVNWKRTDYFYFGTTVLAAAIGIAEFTASSWTHEVQNLQTERGAAVERLRSGARWIDSLCERNNARKLIENDPDRILVPPDERAPEPKIPEPKLSNKNCVEAKIIALSFGEITLEMVIKYIDNSDETKLIKKSSITLNERYMILNEGYMNYYEELKREYKDDILSIYQLLLRELSIPFQYRYEGLILMPVLAISELDVKIASLESQVRLLSSTNIFRHLYPILFGLGLGVRLARTHYDVRVAQRDEAAKRLQPTKPLERLARVDADARSGEAIGD